MATRPTPLWSQWASWRCSATGSGVVLLAATTPSSRVAPRVPMTPQRPPRRRPSCATRRLTVVLPLVPVTPTICSWRLGWPKNRAASSPTSSRNSGTSSSGTGSSSTKPATGASATTAVAPLATACSMNWRPSCTSPGNARNRSPGITSRLSNCRPRIMVSAPMQPGMPSNSASGMAGADLGAAAIIMPALPRRRALPPPPPFQ